jgi:hypothetical protein
MIEIFKFYLISIIVLAIIALVPVLVAKMTYKRYPNSKLANFFRKYIVTDEDLEEYD